MATLLSRRERRVKLPAKDHLGAIDDDLDLLEIASAERDRRVDRIYFAVLTIAGTLIAILGTALYGVWQLSQQVPRP